MDIREVSRRLPVCCLFLSKKPGEGDDVCVNFLAAHGSSFPIATTVGRHPGYLTSVNLVCSAMVRRDAKSCTGVNKDEGVVSW